MPTDKNTLPEEELEDNIKDPYLARALKHLEMPLGQYWTMDSRFISAGRRPMIRYPHIMIAPTELASVIRVFEETLPHQKLWRRVFELVEDSLTTRQVTDRTQNISPYIWLTTWAMTDVLKAYLTECRIKKDAALDHIPRPKLINPRGKK